MTTRKLLGLATIALVMSFTAGTADAHHSRANFDLSKTVEFDGIVSRFEWTNPHTAIVIDVQTPDGKTVSKTFEGNSVATMIRRGFTKTTVKPGDKVHVVANPEKAVGSQYYYLNSISKDGKVLGDGGAGAGSIAQVSPADSGGRFVAAMTRRDAGRNRIRLVTTSEKVAMSDEPFGGSFGSAAQANDTAAMQRFVGVWREGMGGGGGARPGGARPGGARPGNAGANAGARPGGAARPGGGGANGGGGGGNAILLGRPLPSNLPVTAKGAASYAKFDYEADPRNNCVPESLPAAISSAPYMFGIRLDGGNFVFENENYAAPRIIHMDQKAPPAGTKPDYDGYSVGHMEGDTLVIETTLFSPEPWGNDTGLDSSAEKHFIERLTVTDTERGKRLQDAYVQTDPVYLSKPVTRTISWTSTPTTLATVWDVDSCSPEAGNRHLTIGHDPFKDEPKKP